MHNSLNLLHNSVLYTLIFAINSIVAAFDQPELSWNLNALCTVAVGGESIGRSVLQSPGFGPEVHLCDSIFCRLTLRFQMTLFFRSIGSFPPIEPTTSCTPSLRDEDQSRSISCLGFGHSYHVFCPNVPTQHLIVMTMDPIHQ